MRIERDAIDGMGCIPMAGCLDGANALHEKTLRLF
jgi:hypothetical protein